MRAFALAIPMFAIGAVGFAGVAGAAPAVVHAGTIPTSGLDGAAASANATVSGGPKAPKGYVVVSNGVNSPADSQTWGTAACPAGEVVLGGGVYTASSATDVDVSSSFPGDEGEWFVHVSNGSSGAVNLLVFAICADTPKKYSIQSTSVLSPAGQQSSTSTSCPAHTEVLGGGGGWSLGSPVTINSTLPLVRGWRVDVNNEGSYGVGGVVYAICGKEKTVSEVQGPKTDNPPGTQTSESVTCPGATVPLSGGVLGSVGSLYVSANSAFPDGQTWSAYENNASSVDDEAYAEAICGS